MVPIGLIIVRKPMLVLGDSYVSGIVFIGLQVLLSIDLREAFIFTLLTFFVYLGVVSFASFVADTILKGSRSDLASFKNGIVTAGVTTAVVFPYAVIINYLAVGELGPFKYYFYATIMSLVIFVTTYLMHSGIVDVSMIRKLRRLKPEVRKMFFDFYIELIKIFAWSFVFVLLGAAFSGILTGTTISTGEMILIFYTSVGLVCLVMVPIVKGLFDIWEAFLEYMY